MAQQIVSASLVALLGIGERELVAFVGAGGKSTLLLHAGRELADAGLSVVLGTTTKMGSDQIPADAVVCHTLGEVRNAIAAGSMAFLLGGVDGHKVVGVIPGLVDGVHAATEAAVLVEADGARGRSFKAPHGHEPVIPSGATTVVVVAGVDAAGARIDEACHRPERVAELLGRSVDHVLTPSDMASVLGREDGGLARIPDDSRVVVALTGNLDGVADEVAAALADVARIDHVARVPPLRSTGGRPENTRA